MKEIWKDIKGYEGLYQVSNLGRVKSLDRYRTIRGTLVKIKGRILKQYNSKKTYGYNKVCLYYKPKDGYAIRKSFSVHRLVAKVFIENKLNKKTVNHKDGNKLNNYSDNLEWMTIAENTQHAMKNGLTDSKKGVYMCDKSTMKKLKYFNSATEANRYFGIMHVGNINHAIKKGGLSLGYRWIYAKK